MSEAPPIHAVEPAHGHSVPEPHHAVNYFAVFIILVILTIVTVVVALVDLKSETERILLALTIASVKASAVILYFMHVKFEGKLIYLILLVPITFSIMLVIALLPDITFAPVFHEFSTRAWRLVHG
jgi:cytochrome c oxidase subunit 4